MHNDQSLLDTNMVAWKYCDLHWTKFVLSKLHTLHHNYTWHWCTIQPHLPRYFLHRVMYSWRVEPVRKAETITHLNTRNGNFQLGNSYELFRTCFVISIMENCFLSIFVLCKDFYTAQLISNGKLYTRIILWTVAGSSSSHSDQATEFMTIVLWEWTHTHTSNIGLVYITVTLLCTS